MEISKHHFETSSTRRAEPGLVQVLAIDQAAKIFQSEEIEADARDVSDILSDVVADEDGLARKAEVRAQDLVDGFDKAGPRGQRAFSGQI